MGRPVRSRPRWPGPAAPAARCAGSSPAARCATRRRWCCPEPWGRCTPTSRSARTLGCPLPRAPTSAWISGQRNTPAAGRTRSSSPPPARREIIREQAAGGEVAVVLLDVVLGYGSHPDPAGEIADTCAELVAGGAAVVAYVLGTPGDPQDFGAQRRTLREAGAIVTETS